MVSSTRMKVAVVGGVAVAGFVLVLALARTDPATPGRGRPGAAEPAIPAADATTLAASPHFLFRHTAIDAHYGRMGAAPLAEPNASRGVTDLDCERVAFAAGRGICLRANRGVFSTYEAVLFDSRLQLVRTLPLDGSPTRTRVSPDGRFGAITVFVTGAEHGYTTLSFSTKTILLDMTSGDVLGDLEEFDTWRDGARFSAEDFNFWGVTFARDSNTFYASLATAKKTYLVRGDVSRRALTVLHENVECPAIAPDNRRIAYKKRVGPNLAPWRFYVLDLTTMADRPIEAETRSLDDQIEWLDDELVLYGAPRSSQSAVRDVWIAPVDRTGPARTFLVQAESPVVVR